MVKGELGFDAEYAYIARSLFIYKYFAKNDICGRSFCKYICSMFVNSFANLFVNLFANLFVKIKTCKQNSLMLYCLQTNLQKGGEGYAYERIDPIGRNGAENPG